MRRLVLLLVTAVCLMPPVVWLTTDLRPAPGLLDLVPDEAPLVVDWFRPLDSWQRFLSPGADGKGGLPAEHPFRATLDLARPEIGSMIARLVDSCQDGRAAACRELGRKRLVLVLLPENEQTPALPDRMVLLTRMRAHRFLRQLFPEEEEFAGEQYQEITVYRATWPDGQQLFAAQCGEIMLLSVSRLSLESCLQRYWESRVKPRHASVIEKRRMLDRYGGIGPKDLFVHADGSILHDMALSPFFSGTVAGDALLARLLSWHVTSVSLCHSLREETDFSTLVVKMPRRERGWELSLPKRDPVRNQKVSSMPADLLFYFWTNLFDLQALRIVPRRGTGQPELLERVSRWLGRRTGMTLDELLDLLGNRFGCNIAPIHAANPLPVPRLCLCVEVKDRKKIAAVLEKILVGLPVRRDKIGETEIVSVLAAGGLMQPSYALLSNYLILADSREQVEAVLGGREQRLLDSQDFQSVNTGFLKPSNVLTFARPADLVHGLRSLLLWAEPFLALQDAERAAAGRKLLEEKIEPLLGHMEKIKVVGLRFFTESDRLVIKAALRSR